MNPESSAPPREPRPSPLSPPLTWRVHPAAERPLQAALVALFILLVTLLSAVAFRERLFGLLAFAFLSLSLTTYFLPTDYELSDTEIRVRYPFSTRREPLAKFRSVVSDRNGLLLSPAREHRLAHELRSLFLVVPKARRDEARRFLEARLSRADGQMNAVAVK